jgi:hypothetical protein
VANVKKFPTGVGILILEAQDGSNNHEIWNVSNITPTTHTTLSRLTFNEGPNGADYIAKLRTVLGLGG